MNLSDFEADAKMMAMKRLQAELGWIRSNRNPLIVGAIVGAAIVFAIAKFF